MPAGLRRSRRRPIRAGAIGLATVTVPLPVATEQRRLTGRDRWRAGWRIRPVGGLVVVGGGRRAAAAAPGEGPAPARHTLRTTTVVERHQHRFAQKRSAQAPRAPHVQPTDTHECPTGLDCPNGIMPAVRMTVQPYYLSTISNFATTVMYAPHVPRCRDELEVEAVLPPSLRTQIDDCTGTAHAEPEQRIFQCDERSRRKGRRDVVIDRQQHDPPVLPARHPRGAWSISS